MNRFVRWTVTALVTCTLLVPALFDRVQAQGEAEAQLEQTAAAMLALQSFHFELETTAGSTTFQDLLELDGVSGDIVRPSDFQATVSVKLAMISLTFEVIGIDGNLWVKNPLGGSDEFIQMTGAGSEFELPPTLLLNPDQLVSEILNYLDDPALAGTEKLDGQEMTIITGSFDPSTLAGNGTAVAGLENFEPASTPLEIKCWIDDQDRLVRIDFTGPLFSFEEGSGRLVRTIAFSHFDEAISIQPPA